MGTCNLMIVGVGGQGTLLASKILGKVLSEEGYDVKVSEVHGMSQRGGSVVTYVKFGEKVYSPIIDKGEADVIISFEQLEALRYTEYLKPNGKMLISTQKIDPMPVITGNAEYPENIEKLLEKFNVTFIDAVDLALKAGSPKAANIVLLGAFSKVSDISADVWKEHIKKSVPEKFIELNLKAFDLGSSICA
ncbi:MAG: indolepyruvate oxidoreductase subunit beta [Oscillospiraceae bacterium]|nr:indolepyruvate oxidoreductase subunit beta [Oscillospiraceae bacterium]